MLFLETIAPAAEKESTGHPADSSSILFQNLCATCHGAKGEGKVELKAPSIASLPDWYVVRQLQNFREDRRGAHPEDVEGQIMRAISKAVTPAQAEGLARHVAALPRVTPASSAQADGKLELELEAGRDLYAERCMECHRYNAEGELFFGSPPLVGLPDWYLTAQIRKFQKGIRGAEPGDANGQKMVFSSKFVESENLLRSLTGYLVSLQRDAKSTKAEPDTPALPRTGEDPFTLQLPGKTPTAAAER